MASQNQVQERLRVFAKDFTYSHGEWRKPEGDEAAVLIYGKKIEVKAAVNIESLIPGDIGIYFGISKPNGSSGWENARPMIRAQVGSEFITTSILRYYLLEMVPERRVNFFLPLTLLDNSDKVLHLSITDDTEHRKSGFVFHEAVVMRRTPQNETEYFSMP